MPHLERMVRAPEVKVVLREVCHNVNDLFEGETADGSHLIQCFQHVIRELSTPGAQLDNVEWLPRIQRHLRTGEQAVANEAHEYLRAWEGAGNKGRERDSSSRYLRIRTADEGVARDEVRDNALGP